MCLTPGGKVIIRHVVHRNEVLANLTEVTKSLLRMVSDGGLVALLRKKPRARPPGRSPQGRLSPTDIERLVVRYNETKNMRQVAREFGISRTTVRSHLGLVGVTVRASRPMSELEKQKAREMWAAGMTSTQIGKKLGFSHHTILGAVRG